VPEDCPQHIADLIDACFSDQPALRPTADQVVAALQPQPSASPARSAAESKHLADGGDHAALLASSNFSD
jgi:hypothetical protein